MGDNGSIVRATLFGTGLSIALFWLPVVGPLVAGYVAGTKAVVWWKSLISSAITGILIALPSVIFTTAITGLLKGIPIIGTVLSSMIGGVLGFTVIAMALFSVTLLGIGSLVGAAVTP